MRVLLSAPLLALMILVGMPGLVMAESDKQPCDKSAYQDREQHANGKPCDHPPGNYHGDTPCDKEKHAAYGDKPCDHERGEMPCDKSDCVKEGDKPCDQHQAKHDCDHHKQVSGDKPCDQNKAGAAYQKGDEPCDSKKAKHQHGDASAQQQSI